MPALQAPVAQGVAGLAVAAPLAPAARVHGVATATPPHRFRQSDLRDVAEATLPDGPAKETLLEVFAHSRIDERAFAVPIEWLLAPHGFKDRTDAFLAAAVPLAEAAGREALAHAGIQGADLAGIVSVCTTGLATPSLDARLANRLGAPAHAVRMPIWGLGCAGGVAGLARAAELAHARQGPVLFVALEFCSLAFDVQKALVPSLSTGSARADKKALVAASLFADGCAAVVVTPEGWRAAGNAMGPRPSREPVGGALRLVAAGSHLFPGTERVMGWDVEDHNLDVVLSPEIPAIVERHMAGVVLPFLQRHASGRRPDHWLLHPGGAKVVDAYKGALGLTDADLEHTHQALRMHGNMSSPTALFALAGAQRKGCIGRGETALLGALGPGFAAELALLEGV